MDLNLSEVDLVTSKPTRIDSAAPVCATARTQGQSCDSMTEVCERGYECAGGVCTAVDEVGWVDEACQ